MSYIIYSMLLSQHPCIIATVSDVREQKGFKKCFVRVKTKRVSDDTTGEVIREAGEFDCEVALNDLDKHKQLKELSTQDVYVPCTFVLRSFYYKEKGIEKLGKQLQLKRWWR